MKVFCSVLFVLIFLLGCANASEQEITFLDIPWLSDEEVTFQTINKAGFRQPSSLQQVVRDNTYYSYLIENETGFVSPNPNKGMEEVTYIADLAGNVKGKIAGCPIKNLVFTFAYDGAYHLIAVQVVLIGGQYKELLDKLTKVYGGGEYVVTNDLIESTVWKGANNSAVLIYTESEGYDFTLMYGRLDAIEILQSCLAPADPDDVSGL